jgi:hypothetical protein
MSRFADRSRSGRRTGFRMLAILCLLGGAVLFWGVRKESAAPDSEPPQAALDQDATRHEREAKPSVPSETRMPSALVPVSTPVAQAGHEGHGDECAQCLADRKLAAYREDYARMQHARVLNDRDADEEKSLEVLDACRVLAGKVLQEWSFSESRPVLPPDDVVDARQREILEPLLTRLPLKEGSDR